MTIVRVGTTKKYSVGWEAAFGKKGGAKTAVKTKKSASAAVKSKKKAGASAPRNNRVASLLVAFFIQEA